MQPALARPVRSLSLAGFSNAGLTLIAGLMPFHAFLSVWLSTLVGHRAVLQSWKEVAVLGLLGLAAWHLRCDWHGDKKRLQRPYIYAVAAYIGWVLLVSATQPLKLSTLAYGVKTDIVFLVLLIVSAVLATKHSERLVARVIIFSSWIVVAFGTLQSYVLPKDFLIHFGYGPSTIAPFLTLTPGSDAIRILSTLGGPNQLGSFLILPSCLVLSMATRKFSWWHAVYLALSAITLFHTFSRSAWIGAIAAAVVTIIASVSSANRRRTSIGLMLAAGVFALAAYVGFTKSPQLQNYFLHSSYQSYGLAQTSDGERISAQSSAYKAITRNPIGSGLGAAGPASFYSSNPVISENYYLQLALEGGLPGLLLFVAIMVYVAKALWRRDPTSLTIAAFAALIGVSIVNFFLHGWADSSTSLIWAVASGVSLKIHE